MQHATKGTHPSAQGGKKTLGLCNEYNGGMRRKGPSRPRAKSGAVPKIFLGYVCPRSPNLIHEDFMLSVLRLYAGGMGKCQVMLKGVNTGPLLSKARNLLLEYFLKSECDYFLWADTDIVFDYEDLAVLLLADKPIAGSVYCALDAQGTPVVAHLLEKEDSPGVYSDVGLSLCYEEDGSPKEAFRVSGLGCGFTLIKREVIESLTPIKRLWPYAETGEEDGFGEDLTFGLRAHDLGYDSWLVPASRVGHRKEITL